MAFPTTHPALSRTIAARGYTEPTAVQIAVLAEAARERDLLVSAQTGSGKTVAFGLALGSTLLADVEWLEPATAPLALVIAPTRELALQVCRELTWLYEAAGARVITCVGGMDVRTEARQLAGGAHIVVGTPGRLRDHLERRRLNLGRLRAVVLDEADEMLDLGFREDLEFILDATPAERRTLLFSATLPREIESLAGRYQRDAARIATVRRNEQHADIDYRAHRVAPQDIENAVVNVLRFHEARAALVFCATREAVNRLSARLIERGFAAVALSGELTQSERTRALQALRDGRARVLVATDVAARGLDLPDLALVIHAELPNDGETLLHRSGRTGRAGRKGLSVLIVPFNRRRKADALIAAARLQVSWQPAPTPEDVRARDQERFLADPTFTAPAGEDETSLVAKLQATRAADEIALALIRLHGARLPAPEDLMADAGPPRREWQPRDVSDGRRDSRFAGRTDRGRWEPRVKPELPSETGRGDATGPARSAPDSARPPRRPRHEARDMVWFRLNIGRERNAEPRWLLPLICRAGAVTKAEIGAIRIEARETRFQIAAEVADQFEHAARTARKKEGQIVRVGADAPYDGTVADAPVEVAAPAAGPAASRDASQPAKRDAPEKRGKDRWRDRPKSGNGGMEPRRRSDSPGSPDGRPPKRVPHLEGAAARPSTHVKKKHRKGSRPELARGE